MGNCCAFWLTLGNTHDARALDVASLVKRLQGGGPDADGQRLPRRRAPGAVRQRRATAVGAPRQEGGLQELPPVLKTLFTGRWRIETVKPSPTTSMTATAWGRSCRALSTFHILITSALAL